MVRSSRVVLPDPGDETRFSARMFLASNQPRLRWASRLFCCRMSISTCSVREPAVIVVMMMVMIVIVMVVHVTVIMVVVMMMVVSE